MKKSEGKRREKKRPLVAEFPFKIGVHETAKDQFFDKWRCNENQEKSGSQKGGGFHSEPKVAHSDLFNFYRSKCKSA